MGGRSNYYPDPCTRSRSEFSSCPEWRVFFTGHIPQVKEQVIMLQIYIQDQMRLLALIIIQNVLSEREENCLA